MKTIPLTHGKFAIVDDEDYPELIKHKWIAVRRHSDPRHEIWIAGCFKDRGVYMHREILGLERGDNVEVLHINGNRLDNRKANIIAPGHRIVVRGRKFGKGESRYKGVHRDHWSKEWAAGISIDGKNRHLGLFSSERDAALAYDFEARKTYGQLMALNFPQLEVRSPPPRLPSKMMTSKSSKYRGVVWHKRAKKWQAKAKQNKRSFHLGSFDSEEDAARAYDAAVLRLGTNRRHLNFPKLTGYDHSSTSGAGTAHKVSSEINLRQGNEAIHSDQHPQNDGKARGIIGVVRAFFSGLRRHLNDVPATSKAAIGWQTEQKGSENLATG